MGRARAGPPTLVGEDHLSPQRLRGVGALRRMGQVFVVPIDRVRLRSAFAQLFRPPEQEERVERALRARKATTLCQQRRARQVHAPPITGGVGEGEQVLARGGLERRVDAVPIDLREDAVPMPAREIGRPAARARALGQGRGCGSRRSRGAAAAVARYRWSRRGRRDHGRRRVGGRARGLLRRLLGDHGLRARQADDQPLAPRATRCLR